MITWYRLQNAVGPGNHRRPDLVTGIGATIVAMVSVTGISIGIAGCISGGAKSPAVNPDQTVSYNGQVFGRFQPDEVNAIYGVAQTVRGKPLQTDPLWNVIPARDQIIINGLLYTDCTGEKPVVQDRLRFQELVCKRQHRA
jgi:hypothetical protein